MKKFIKYLKSITLSESEKSLLRYRIQEFISFNPIRHSVPIPKQSFYFSIFTFRTLSKGIALVLVILLVVGGTGVSYASTDALPGDTLYPIKINLNEKIEEKLAFTSEAKVAVQTQKVERRLTEAQKLVEKKDLSPENKAIVKMNLEKNVDEVTKTIENLKDDGKVEAALEITSKITPVLEAHKEVLTEQHEDEIETMNMEADTTATFAVEAETDTLLESVDAAIKKVEEAEERVIEKATEDKTKAEEVADKNAKEVSEKIETIKKESDAEVVKEEMLQTQEVVDVEVTLKSVITTDNTTTETLPVAETALVDTVITSDTDIEAKVKFAELLLLQAKTEQTKGNYKEALTFSQDARKVIQQIEEYQKIKNEAALHVELEEKTQTKTNEESAVKTEPAATTSEETVLPQKETIHTSKDDIKAQAIQSLEETTNSFKKLNVNITQEVGSRLLP